MQVFANTSLIKFLAHLLSGGENKQTYKKNKKNKKIFLGLPKDLQRQVKSSYKQHNFNLLFLTFLITTFQFGLIED